MKTAKRNFYEFNKQGKFLPMVVCAMSLFCIPLFAASNGCDETEGNEFINQRLALCSTHAYNIGAMQNPSSAAERETMNEVVALKTTIMTQQMKKQYDYLEVTIKRFKTQLEKAILVSKLEASGAATGAADGGGRYSSTSQSMGDDCTGKNRTDTAYCLRQNYAKMRAAVDAKAFNNDLKEQIVKDTKALFYMDGSLMSVKKDNQNVPNDCAEKSKLNQTTIPECLGKISGAINALEEGAKKQQSSNSQPDR